MEEKIFFINIDGLKLFGVITKPKKNTKKCIILCHGITVDNTEYGVFIDLTKELANAGFAVLRFDFRGHGKSEGNSVYLTVTGEKKDLESAVQFVLDKGYSEIGILAASFAGGVASLFTAQYPKLIKAYVLWNSLLNYISLLKPANEWQKKHWGPDAIARAEKKGYTELSRGFKIGIALFNELNILNPVQELKKATVPMLFIHGTHDDHVSIEDSIQASRAVKNGELKIIEGAEHGFDNDKKLEKEAIELAVTFFKKNV